MKTKHKFLIYYNFLKNISLTLLKVQNKLHFKFCKFKIPKKTVPNLKSFFYFPVFASWLAVTGKTCAQCCPLQTYLPYKKY